MNVLKPSHAASLLILILLAVSATLLVLRATPEGLGLSDDSIAYIAGARSLLAGQGYREAWLASNGPVTHFPPGFPAALAFIGLFGLDPLRGARFLNALLFGLSTILLGILGWRMTRSLPAGLILAALFAANDPLLVVHTTAMSEPLFIFFSLLAFWAFDLHFERDGHGLWILACGILSGLAYLTRYAGLALLATFIAALLILHENGRKRLRNVVVFLAGALPWMIAWSIRNRIVGGSVTNRGLAWHPPSAENFDIALYNASTFLVPIETWRKALFKIPFLFEGLIGLILGAILIWILLEAWRTLRRPPPAARPGTIAFANALYIFGYLIAMLASMSFFDASTKFKLRILVPVYVSLLILLMASGAWLWGRRREVALGLALLVFSMSVYGEANAVAQLEKGGQGFASFQWYRSQAMAFLRGLPADIKIYTNEPAAVYLYTGRGTYVLPDRFDPVTAAERPGFERGVALMQTEIKAGRAVLALFSGSGPSDEDRLILTQGLYLAHKSAGDEIYTAAP